MKKLKLIIVMIVALLLVTSSPVFADCGGTRTQLFSCSGKEAGVGAIGGLIRIAVIVMTVLIGVVATGGLAYAAAIYASARDDQEKVSQAKGTIRNVVIGLLLYGFMIAIINWLIPGGVIG